MVLLLLLLQFGLFTTNVCAKTVGNGNFSLITDDHGLIGYGFSNGSVLHDSKSFYVYGRLNTNQDWIKLSYSEADDDYYDAGWHWEIKQFMQNGFR